MHPLVYTYNPAQHLEYVVTPWKDTWSLQMCRYIPMHLQCFTSCALRVGGGKKKKKTCLFRGGTRKFPMGVQTLFKKSSCAGRPHSVKLQSVLCLCKNKGGRQAPISAKIRGTCRGYPLKSAPAVNLLHIVWGHSSCVWTFCLN